VDPARRSEDDECTCGRPLGLQFYSKTGDLYFIDAYMGLMRAGPADGVDEVVAAEAGGVPFNITIGFDIDQATGDVYFTYSSTSYPPPPRARAKIPLCRAFFQTRTTKVFLIKSKIYYKSTKIIK
jgi:hypothetical protein